MKTVPAEKAAGLVLGHDLTEIIPGGEKKAAFKKGQVLTAEDIPRLLRMGKTHVHVWTDQPKGLIHEDEAARRLARALAGEGLKPGEPSEGRVDIYAVGPGLFLLNTDLLEAVNDIPEVTVASIGRNRLVAAGQPVAGARVVPLCVREEAVLGVEDLARAHGALLSVRPLLRHRIGLVITGTEVHQGLVEDGFTPVLRRKFEAWGSEIAFHRIVPDEHEGLVRTLGEALETCDLLAVTGGMSVDPDDRTPAAIRKVSGQVVTYGAPVFPGAMLMLAYHGRRPVLGLPGCVMHRPATLFDLITPRLLAGQRLTRRDITALAHGGFCPRCSVCRFPDCAFGG
ncbi:MAG: molybdopterin-binding protein [Deltaproteobacteria bacterium]|nr:molybdopterin-binding protein [Deltaproteobacteria bacterium]